jgi:hypothetical protein
MFFFGGGGKARPTRKAENLTAICVPIVYKMWESRRPYALSHLFYTGRRLALILAGIRFFIIFFGCPRQMAE